MSSTSTVLSQTSSDDNVTAAVLVCTVLGIFLVLAVTLYCLHRGPNLRCTSKFSRDEESAIRHHGHKPNHALLVHAHKESADTAHNGEPLSQDVTRKVASESRREKLIAVANHCTELMLQKHRVDDIPATYDRPFNSREAGQARFRARMTY